METDVFGFESYKSFLKKLVKSERGVLTRLAKAAGCELSYLSRSLSHEINITSDQAFKIANYLKMSTLERDYFLTLVEIERSGDKSYADFLKKRAAEFANENENLKSRVQRPVLTGDVGQFLYHSNWLYSAMHILVSIGKYQKVSEICRRFHISIEQANSVLSELVSMGFINKNSDSSYEYAAGATHTPKESPLVVMHHQNWRQRAVMDSQNLNSDGVHYTGVQSMSEEDYKKIKNLILDTISRSEKIASPSEPQELVSIGIDIFRV